jgi:hypothetical protein
MHGQPAASAVSAKREIVQANRRTHCLRRTVHAAVGGNPSPDELELRSEVLLSGLRCSYKLRA